MKRNKLISLIAFLLACVMILSSCAGPDDDSGKGDPGELGGDFIPKDYSAEIEKWAQYLSYEAPDGKTAPTINKLNVSDKELNVQSIGNNYATVSFEDGTHTVVDPNGVLPDEIVKDYDVVTIDLYSAKTGNKIQSFVSKVPVSTYSELTGDLDISENAVRYTFDVLPNDIIEVVTERAKLIPEVLGEGQEPTPDYEASFANYAWETVSYDYYYADRAMLSASVEEPAQVRIPANTSAAATGRFLLDAGDKTYLFTAEGEVIATFPLGCEYDIPVYDEEQFTPGSYAYFEIGNYRYVLKEEVHQQTIVGDLVLDLLPGISLTVTDAQFNPKAQYDTNCYGVAAYAFLANGNLYIAEYESLNDDATDYDFIMGEAKLKVNHKLVNAENGAVTVLDLDYLPTKLFNNNTASVNSYASMMAMNKISADTSLLANCKVNGNYIIAEIQKYSEGVIESESVFAVINESTLAIEAELPKLLPDQFGFPGYLDANTMLVISRTTNNRVLTYTLDKNTGKAELFLDSDRLASVKPIENGYLYGNSVYDANWNLLLELDDYGSDDDKVYTNPTVVDGHVYCKEIHTDYSDEYGFVKINITKSIYDGENRYSMSINEVISSFYFGNDKTVSTDYVDFGILVLKSTESGEIYGVYSLSGSQVCSVASETYTTHKTYYDEDDYAHSEAYSATESLVFTQTPAGNLCFIRTTVETRKTTDPSEASQEQLEGQYTYREYFIVAD